MPQTHWEPDAAGTFWGAVKRKDENGVIFLTAEGKFDFFAAVLNEDDIRSSIEEGMKISLGGKLKNPQVFTNGTLSGPAIEFGVKER